MCFSPSNGVKSFLAEKCDTENCQPKPKKSTRRKDGEEEKSKECTHRSGLYVANANKNIIVFSGTLHSVYDIYSFHFSLLYAKKIYGARFLSFISRCVLTLSWLGVIAFESTTGKNDMFFC